MTSWPSLKTDLKNAGAEASFMEQTFLLRIRGMATCAASPLPIEADVKMRPVPGLRLDRRQVRS
jgi:hypothetical protein